MLLYNDDALNHCMTTLIVTLPQELPLATAQFDYVLTVDGRSVAGQSRVPLALLPPAANGDVVAVVPVRALSWHQVQLPKGLLAKNFLSELSEGSTPRLRAVLDGLLEDRLLDEPAQLHLALAPGARDDAPVWVAACDRAWLRTALQTLEQSGRPVARIVPEFAPGGFDNTDEREPLDGEAGGGDALHVIGTAEDAHMVFIRSGALTVLPLTHASVVLAAWPEDAAVLAEPGVAALAESLFKRRVGLQQTGQRWLRAAQSGWDLAQFDLVNSSRTRTWKRASGLAHALLQAPRWRAARWATVALVVANLVGLNAWAWKERNSLDAKRQAVRDVLTTTFPGVKVVIDAPVQMGRELAVLRQATGGASSGDFESLLASFEAVALVKQAPSAIEFVANEVRIKGLSLSGVQVSEAADKLKRAGLAARAEGDSLLLKPEVNQ
jgi:general secretion pathway protein L